MGGLWPFRRSRRLFHVLEVPKTRFMTKSELLSSSTKTPLTVKLYANSCNYSRHYRAGSRVMKFVTRRERVIHCAAKLLTQLLFSVLSRSFLDVWLTASSTLRNIKTE